MLNFLEFFHLITWELLTKVTLGIVHKCCNTFTFFQVRSCLESFIDLGYDLSLFESEELEIVCQKQGYLVNFE